MAPVSWPQEFILMALLADQPDHGYGLYRRLQADPGWGQIWRIQRSEVYFLLRKLSALGLVRPLAVEKGGGPARSKLALTALGRRRLREWMRSPVSSPRELRAAFVAKLYLALQDGPRVARALVDRQRQLLRRRLREEKKLPRGGAIRAAIEIRSVQTRAALEYLDGLEKRLVHRRRSSLRQGSVRS
ncbi:MAG TPA: PadR family transcriptional regulator [Anaerolineales bacterium]|nr:PadR family transcriptional regulator [Anaerolineales bacterium]